MRKQLRPTEQKLEEEESAAAAIKKKAKEDAVVADAAAHGITVDELLAARRDAVFQGVTVEELLEERQEKMDAVGALLSSLGLTSFLDELKAEGIASVDDLALLDAADMKRMGMSPIQLLKALFGAQADGGLTTFSEADYIKWLFDGQGFPPANDEPKSSEPAEPEPEPCPYADAAETTAAAKVSEENVGQRAAYKAYVTARNSGDYSTCDASLQAFKVSARAFFLAWHPDRFDADHPTCPRAISTAACQKLLLKRQKPCPR